MSKKVLVTEMLLIFAALAVSFLSYSHLPARIVTHWGTDMQPDGWSARIAIFGLGPGLMSGITILTVLGPWLSPQKFESFGYDSIYERVMFTVFCLVTWLFAALLWNALGRALDISRFMISGLCMAAAIVGNMFGKYRKNTYAGIRTPWTLADERVWYATHRVAGWSTTLSGTLGFVLAFFGMGELSIALILIGFAIPAVYSLVYFKGLIRSGDITK